MEHLPIGLFAKKERNTISLRLYSGGGCKTPKKIFEATTNAIYDPSTGTRNRNNLIQLIFKKYLDYVL